MRQHLTSHTRERLGAPAGWFLHALSWCCLFFWSRAEAVYQESLDYLPVPEAARPLQGLLPNKGIESPQGLLEINSKYLKRKHVVNFDTREVEIVDYVRIGPPGDSTADSTALWQSYYRELNNYSTDMFNLLLRRRWLLEFAGHEEASPGGTPGTFVFDLPFQVPEWMKLVGIDQPKLTINGSYKLILEGTRKSGSGAPYASSAWFPDLHMDQQPLFSVKGSVGRFISVEINSEEGVNTNLKQQLQVSYKGQGDELEDDVVQEVEAGNTSLSLTGTNLTGYTENHQGLFGLKARFKLGNLEITGIASQEGGSQQVQTFGPGNQSSQTTIADKSIDFYRHFWVKLSDRTDYSNPANWTGSYNGYVQGGQNRRPMYVYRLLGATEIASSTNKVTDTSTACAYDASGNKDKNLCVTGRWVSLPVEGTDFIYNDNLRMLTVPSGYSEITLAVRWQGDPIQTSTGEATADTRDMVLIYSKDHKNDPMLDSLMWRNVYAIPRVAPQNVNTFNLSVLDNEGRTGAPGDSITYVRRLGLEKFNQPGKLDVDNNLLFDFTNGFLILPCLTDGVAGGDPGNCLEPMRRVTPDVKFYSETIQDVQNGSSSSNFQVVGQQRQSTFNVRENSFSANGQQCFDISPGTERLVLNGSTVLQKDVDYSVVYETGQISLISPRALDPNATISVSYECNPAFQIQDKVLVGTRLEYKLDNISDQSLLGATALFKSQTTTQQQPEVGHEPFSQLLLGFNARLAGEPKWMTNFANLFPLVHTDAPSKADFEFEVAQSYYDPNTRNSAYIDNFDFSQNVSSLPLTLYSWSKASPPAYDDNGKPDDTLDYRHQGDLIWHSSFKEQYYQIYGNTGNSYTNSREQTLLKFQFTPNDNLQGNSWGGVMRGFTQGFTDQSLKRTLEVVVQGQGGTVYADLGQISEDISIVANHAPNNSNPGGGTPDGKPDGMLESELLPGATTSTNDCGLDGSCSEKPNGYTEIGGEWECKPSCYFVPRTGSDPNHDDYTVPTDGATEEPYGVDGTENNNSGTQGFAFDTEDLDHSGGIDTTNIYLRYRMPLDSACTANFYCQELANGWRKYDIPLYGGGVTIDPTNSQTVQNILANVKIMRLWLGHLPPHVAKSEVLFAEVNIVGNTWLEGQQNTGFEISSNQFGSGDLGDSTYINVPPTVPDSNLLRIDVVNKQQQPNYFQSPNTPHEVDASTGEPLPEIAVVLHYQNLHAGEAVAATRLLSNDPKDLTQYSRLSLQIHPDSDWVKSAKLYDPRQNHVSFGLQLGRDRGDGNSVDYYEMRLHMDTTLQQAGTDQSALWTQNSFTVNLDDLTGLKNDPLYRAFNGRPVSHNLWNPARNDSSLTVSVVGNPNLSQVNWMRLVIYVDSGATEKQNGEIWVDDLDLNGVNQASGMALRSQIQLNFADFINVSGNLQYTNGEFMTLTQQQVTRGNADTKIDYNSNVSLFANKFMPDAWAVNLPISLSYQGSLDRPFVVPYSDINLQGTGLLDISRDLFNGQVTSIHNPGDSLNDVNNRYARVYQTQVSNQQFSTSYSKAMSSKDFWTRALFERPSLEYRYSASDNSQYYSEATTRDYKFKLSYNLSPKENPALKILGFTDKWKFMPSALSDLAVTPLPEKLNLVLADYSFVRDYSLTKPRTVDDLVQSYPAQYTVDLAHGVDLEWRPLPVFDFGYRLDIDRTFDQDHTCFERESFFDPNPSHCDGMFAHNLIFDWDQSYAGQKQTYWEKTSPTDSILVDTTHYGREYGILARERNRNESFHSDLNLNPLSWLTAGGSFNSDYRHTWVDPQLDVFGQGVVVPSHFSANADHDVRLTLGVNPTSLLGSLASASSGLKGLSSALGDFSHKLDAYRPRNLDLTYTVSNKYNNEAFTYAYLRNNGIAWNNLMAYQLGFLYDPSNLMTLFRGEPDPRFFDYLSSPDPALGQTTMNHLVNRTVDLETGFTLPSLKLDLSGSLKYSNQYTLYRSFQPSDTTVIWPEYTVSGSFGDFASKLPVFRNSLRSMTAYTNYNYIHETDFSVYSPTPDVDKITHQLNPLLRVTATTNSDVRIEVSLTGAYTREVDYGKDASADLAQPLTYLGDQQPLVSLYVHDSSLVSPKTTLSAGLAPTLSWNLETQKGIQFWRYYIKLRNNLRMTVNSAINYTLSKIEDLGTVSESQNQFTAMIKPEADYNFTNNVDAKFWLQYEYDQYFNTPNEEYVHSIEIHGEFTMRF